MAKNKFFKKLGSKLKGAVEKVGKAAKLAAENIPFAPLIPFRGLMEKTVKKDGGKPEKELSKLTRQFHAILKKKRHSSFDDSLSHNVDMPENLVDDIASIVADIISFFRKAKENKDSGKGTPFENEVGAEVDGVNKAQNIFERIRDGKPVLTIGHEVKTAKGGNTAILIVGGLAIAGVIYAISKK